MAAHSKGPIGIDRMNHGKDMQMQQEKNGRNGKESSRSKEASGKLKAESRLPPR